MTKRIVTRAAAVALAILLPVLLGAAKCEEGDTHPSAPRVPDRQPAPTPGRAIGTAKVPQQPDPHAGDPQPSGHKERIITVQVRVGTKEQLPATVHISTVGGFVQPPTINDIIADTHRTTYTLTFDANAPTPLSVLASLVTSKGGQASYCSMEGGSYGNDGPRFTAGQNNVTCHLLVKRPA